MSTGWAVAVSGLFAISSIAALGYVVSVHSSEPAPAPAMFSRSATHALLVAPSAAPALRTEVKCYTRLTERAKKDAFGLCDELGGQVSVMSDEVSCWSGDPYEDGSEKLFVYTLEMALADDAEEDGGAP